MSTIKAITQWLSKCPQLAKIINISAEPRDGTYVVLPAGSSSRRSINDTIDVTGCYTADIIPSASVYQEFQINCYQAFYSNDNEFNVLKYDEVEAVINWINKQDEIQNFPDIDGIQTVAVETFPFIPQIRGADPETGLICYYITLRITYVNMAKGRSVEYV